MNKETLLEVIALLNTANYDTYTLNHKRDEVVSTLKKQLNTYNFSKSVTASTGLCKKCKANAVVTYIDGKQCTSCGYVC